MKSGKLASLQKALSVPGRLGIFVMIEERPLLVNAISRWIEISQPSVSPHLAVLKHTGSVTGARQGYRVYYSVNAARFEEFRKAVAAFPD